MSKILDSIRSIEFDKNRNKNFGLKSAIVWGHSNRTNSCYPLIYISKPKHVSQEDFEDILDKLQISILKETPNQH